MAFENVFRGIDFQAPNRAAREDTRMLMQGIGQGIAAYERGQERDIRRRQQEIEVEKLKRAEQAAAAKAAGNYEQVAMDELARINSGLPPTPEGQAAIKVMQQTTAAKTYFDPQSGHMVTQPSPWGGLSVGLGGVMPTTTGGIVPDAPAAPLPMVGMGRTPDFNPQAVPPIRESELNDRIKLGGAWADTPAGEKKVFEENVKLEGQKIMADYESQIKQAEEALKTKKGKTQVSGILSKMNKINEELKSMGAIMSQDQDVLDRASTYAATTGLGQEARKVTNPKAQALAEEYEKLQSTLLPFYASAADLGAKSLDSEGERKSILSSFGDPSGLYEANKEQLQNLNNLFGVNSVDSQMESFEERKQQALTGKPTRQQIIDELNRRRQAR